MTRKECEALTAVIEKHAGTVHLDFVCDLAKALKLKLRVKVVAKDA